MKLFEELKAKNIDFKNRIIMPPMATAKADDDGHITQDILDYYQEKTCDKLFSTVIIEHNFIDPLGKASHNQVSIADDSSIEGLKKLAKIIKNNGSQAIVQISHAGSSTNKDVIGESPVAPSAIKNPSNAKASQPRELTIEEIKEIEDKFRDAAVRVKEAVLMELRFILLMDIYWINFYHPLLIKELMNMAEISKIESKFI